MQQGLYIHIPFCRNKCLYCDFYTGGARIADWQVYTHCLLKELEARKEELTAQPATLYIGGGTPSLIPNDIFSGFIEQIREKAGFKNLKEFTIEVNPEDVDEGKAKLWKDTGINRVSLGVQTLNDSELKLIGRRHDATQALEALEILKEHFENISVDVMFGLPGQTVKTFRDTLDKILEIRLTHISAYSLMLEKGTALTHLADRGKIQLPSEDEWLEMFRILPEILKSCGYNRYEISNYCQQGYESEHNKSYWGGKPYLGLGPGAHSYDGGNVRRANPNDIKGYLKFFGETDENSKEETSFFEEERLSDIERQEEMLMTRLRTRRGLYLPDYLDKLNKESKETFLQIVGMYKSTGDLKEKEGYLSFTDKGFVISDRIITSLM